MEKLDISPKAVAAFATPLSAALLLWLITGDDEWLVGILVAFLGGGGAAAAPPASGVRTADLPRLRRLDQADHVARAKHKPGPPQPPDRGKPGRHG